MLIDEVKINNNNNRKSSSFFIFARKEKRTIIKEKKNIFLDLNRKKILNEKPNWEAVLKEKYTDKWLNSISQQIRAQQQ